jgi:hypothetical protein
MMQLINIDTEGRQPEDHRKGFVSYDNFVIDGKRFFVDIHPLSSGSIFGSGEPIYTRAQMYIHHPHIYVHSLPDRKGTDKQFYEQQPDVDLTVKSILIGHGDWEFCTEPNFAGTCKILNPVSREYLDNSNNFSAFGIGERIRSLRPLPDKLR